MNTLENLQQQSKGQLKKSVVASFVGTLGSSIFSFGMGLMILKVTGSAMSFSFSLIVGPLVALLLMPIVGSTVDKYNHKKIILISQAGTILALIAYMLYTYLTMEHFFLVSALLIVVLRISDQFTGTAQTASKIQVVTENDLTSLAGYQQTASSMVGLFSSMLGAILYAALPFYLFVILEITTEVITYLITLSLDFSLGKNYQALRQAAAVVEAKENNQDVQPTTQDAAPEETVATPDNSFKAGLRFIGQQKFLLIFLVIGASLNFFSSVINVGLPVLLLNGLKTSTFQLGLFDTLFSLGFMLSGMIIGRIKPARYVFRQGISFSYLIALSNFLMGLVLFFPLPHFIQFILLLLLAFVMGITITFINVPINVWLQKNIPQHYQGRVFAVTGVASSILMPLGIIVYGFLFDLDFMPLLPKGALLLIVTGVLMALITFSIVKISRVDLKNPTIILPAENK
ncbi:MFS transporter [Enterococcus nangangensis]|uniref:MFS transporter n=1 Tax=Enterococcus nangangensis TaxID=2559926 RepID=UPI0010F4C16B|nr:MFS transporter [Enterococcus nangangensis]